jgi:DNA-binding MarR family transcriptional regulator
MEQRRQYIQKGEAAYDELGELLARASWRLRRRERQELAPYGLTFAQARALRVLTDTGALRIGDLATALEIVPRSATDRVDGLETAGLVSRSVDPADRRSVLVTATDKGRELVARLAADRRASAAALFAPLSSEDGAELVRLLRSITEDT